MSHSLLNNLGFGSAALYLQKSNTFLSRLLMSLAILAFFYYSSVVVWQLIYPQGFEYKTQTVSTDNSASSYNRSQQSWAWFVDSSIPKKPPAPPPSKINAKLLGVIAQGGADGGDGIALIAVKNVPKVYSIGDELSPGIILESVASSFVVLKRGDVDEILEMERPESIFKASRAKARVAAGGGSQAMPNAATFMSAEDVKTILVEKPSKILEAVQIERYQDQKHGTGFRIRPRDGHESVLSMLGLDNNDVLLSVNGKNMTQLPMNKKGIAAMLQAGPLKIKVLRGGVVTEVVVQ